MWPYLHKFTEETLNEKLHFLWNVNNLYGWVMSPKPRVNNFERIKDISQLNEDFIKNYNEESDER